VSQITNAHIIRAVELILFGNDPHYEASSWVAAGITCRRDRHRYTGETYAFSLEILHLRSAVRGSSSWTAMIVTERWSAGVADTVVRSQKWMKLISGKPADLRAWINHHRAPQTELSARVAEP